MTDQPTCLVLPAKSPGQHVHLSSKKAGPVARMTRDRSILEEGIIEPIPVCRTPSGAGPKLAVQNACFSGGGSNSQWDSTVSTSEKSVPDPDLGFGLAVTCKALSLPGAGCGDDEAKNALSHSRMLWQHPRLDPHTRQHMSPGTPHRRLFGSAAPAGCGGRGGAATTAFGGAVPQLPQPDCDDDGACMFAAACELAWSASSRTCFA